ncbi:MAG: hypothetical protein LBI37_02505, partial [Puniceicoccales bacterium]|nr:hypothetical protein [Puniceicoccales bacterium]
NNLDIIRPADGEETVGAWAVAMGKKSGPTALILTRQAVNALNSLIPQQRRAGVAHGGYVAKKEISDLKLIIIATCNELRFAMDAGQNRGFCEGWVHSLLRDIRWTNCCVQRIYIAKL